MKVSDLSGAELDYLVAKALGMAPEFSSETLSPCVMVPRYDFPGCEGGHYAFSPSTDWAQGGPIIEREKIDLVFWPSCNEWRAGVEMGFKLSGQTALVAAMRAFVASKFGEEVEEKRPESL